MAANLSLLHGASFSTLLCLEKPFPHFSQLEHRHLVEFDLLILRKSLLIS